MQVLKVVAEGLVTSFRYPHFVQGVQLTFEMPPPATIYGHVCSAVGEEFDPAGMRFAYHFTWQAKFMDYEHLHFFGKEPKMNPFSRELLFRPSLTLYLNNPEFLPFFLSPRYPVVLGRSQDLMTYVVVKVIDLKVADQGYLENTLLTLEDAARIGGHTYAVTMPRFLSSARIPTWGQYAILRGSVLYPNEDDGSYRIDGEEEPTIWVDPENDARHPTHPLQRSVIWHSWV